MTQFLRADGQRRVVVTGMAIISPIGIGLTRYWQSLEQGISGIRRIQRFDPSHLNVQIAGEVLDFNPLLYMNRKRARQLERSSQFAIAAAQMALDDAGFTTEQLEANTERTSVMMGTAFGGFDAMQRAVQDVYIGKRPSPFALVSSLSNMPTFYVAETARATGYNSSITTACAAGTQAIGSSSQLIRSGRAEIAIAGGVEALITDYTIACFDSMTSLARGFNDKPSAASRPFDADRNGFIFSEGAGILVLESLERATKRGAKIYAEVAGHATSNDAYHITAIDPEGKGARRVMRWALDDAHLSDTALGYINAHGTGTRSNDPIESAAIAHVFKNPPPISSIKSMTGHALGAAGAIEAVATILALQKQVLPPTINYEKPDPECPLDYVPNIARPHRFQHAMSNSFGLGGHNASIVFSLL